MPGFDLLIYDCDGVLVDSEVIAAQVESQLLTDAGYEISAEEIGARFSGLTWKAILLQIEQETDTPLQATLIDKAERLIDKRLARDVRAIEGVAAAVLRIDMKRCVCSNSSNKRLDLMLTKTGLAPLFGAHVFSAMDTPDVASKPAPDIFLHAAKTMGSEPARTLVVEDSVHGVEGARAAGMRVIGFTGGGHSHPGHADQLMEAGAETVISRMADLPETVKALAAWSEHDN